MAAGSRCLATNPSDSSTGLGLPDAVQFLPIRALPADCSRNLLSAFPQIPESFSAAGEPVLLRMLGLAVPGSSADYHVDRLLVRPAHGRNHRRRGTGSVAEAVPGPE